MVITTISVVTVGEIIGIGERMKVAVIDLFCGMGGFTQGAIEAGAEGVLAVDSWEAALAVHHTNHPGVPISRVTLGERYQFSIFKKLVDKYRALGYHVHIHGSPPCQALSNASNRNPEEGMPLVIWFLDCVKFADPDSWSMENVVPVRKRLPEGTPSVILNSADFGVAQTRRRCFAGEGWVANPTHSKDEWLGVIDVLPHLKELVRPPVTSQSVKQIRLEALGSNAKRNNDREISEPSKTICGSGNQVGARIFNHSENKPEKIRSLTIQETLILQGFSHEYDLGLARTQKARWTMIGNAVVPAVARAVIEGIK